jgi:hypothetical protein
MKTIPLEKALKLATKGPLVPSSDPRRYPAVIAESGTWVAKTDCSINSRDWTPSEPVAEANAALLAHFYNHGPELVRVLDDLVAAQIDPTGIKAAKVCKEAATLLAKASTVQMP